MQPERTDLARETDRLQQATVSDARRRALVAGCVGNLVEWYDFALYGAFATVLAAVFFPEADPVGALLATFAVLGGENGGSAAFVIEFAPVDRRGRYGGWQWATTALLLRGEPGGLVLGYSVPNAAGGRCHGRRCAISPRG